MGFPTDKLVPADNLLSSCASVEQMQGVNFLLEHCSMLNSKTFRAYPDCHVVTLVLAYRKDNRKRAVRQLVKEAARRLKKRARHRFKPRRLRTQRRTAPLCRRFGPGTTEKQAFPPQRG